MNESELRSEDIYVDNNSSSSSAYDSDEDPEFLLSNDNYEGTYSDSSTDSSEPNITKRPRLNLVSIASTSSSTTHVSGLTEQDEDSDGATTRNNNPGRPTEPDITWSHVTGGLIEFQCNKQGGFNVALYESCIGKSPVDYYQLFIDSEIIDEIVIQTNKYAEQKIVQGILDQSIKPHSICTNWTETNSKEIMRFMSIVIYMGLVTLPKIRDYWSKNVLYKNEFIKATNSVQEQVPSIAINDSLCGQ